MPQQWFGGAGRRLQQAYTRAADYPWSNDQSDYFQQNPDDYANALLTQPGLRQTDMSGKNYNAFRSLLANYRNLFSGYQVYNPEARIEDWSQTQTPWADLSAEQMPRINSGPFFGPRLQRR